TVTLTGTLAAPPGTQLTLTGSGELDLSQATRCTTQININGGTLGVTANDQLGSGAAVSIGALGTLRGMGTFTSTKNMILAAGSSVSVDPGFTMTFPTSSGSGGSLTLTGPGILTFTGSAAHTGGTTISAGTLALSGGGNLPSTSTLVNNATFDISQVTTSSTLGAITGSGTVSLGSKLLTINADSPSTFDGIIQNGGIGGGTGGNLTKTG